VIVTLHDSQTALSVSQDQIQILMGALSELKQVVCDEIIIHLVDKMAISKVHQDFFDDSSPTDCISFPIDSPKEQPCSILGEIFACPEVAIEYGKEHNIDPYKELSLYLIHGFLHLIGFDDLQENDRVVMREEERVCMDYVEKNSLLLKRTLV